MTKQTTPIRIGLLDYTRRQRLLALSEILAARGETTVDLTWPEASEEERAMTAAGGLSVPGPAVVLTLENQLAPHSPLVSGGVASVVRRDAFETLTVPLLDRSARAGWQTTPELLNSGWLSVVDSEPRRLSAFIQTSDQLARQNLMMAAVFAEAQLLAAVSGALDKAALQGTGADGQPPGIAGDTQLPSVTQSAANVSAGDLAKAEEKMATGRDENGLSRWLAAPGTRKALRNVADLWPAHAPGPLGYGVTASPDAPEGFLALCQPAAITYFIWRMTVENLITREESLAGWRSLLVTCWCDVAITRPQGIVKVMAPE